METTKQNPGALYRHTQYSNISLAVFGIVLLFVFMLMLARGFEGWPLLAFIFLALCLITFSSLTTEVRPGRVMLRFGPGPLRRTILLSDIRNVCTVQIDPRAGIGIHWWYNLWYYNVAGLQAVELEMREANPIRIGTDDPEGLAKAIEDALILKK